MKKIKKELDSYRLAVIKQMVQLATAGFGLVAALAWNELIKTFIEELIRPALGVGSGLVSLLIYAIIVTALAVFITLQLSRTVERMEKEKDEEESSKDHS